MKITIVKNKKYGFANLKFSEKPDYVKDKALLDELKASGWGYSKYNGVWYPHTNEAKAKANDFAKEIVEKYSEPEKSFGQELFERTQRIDAWKMDHLNVEVVEEKTEQSISELDDVQKKLYEVLKSAGSLSEEKILEMIPQIQKAANTGNFEPVQKMQSKELSLEEKKSLKRVELSEQVPEILKGREFSSWIISPSENSYFLFYESNGYLKSEYLNQEKYESIKNFLTIVEADDLMNESAKQLKTEYEKMHGLLKTPAEEIEITEERHIELNEEDLEYAQKVIPEEQYMDMLQEANGEESEHFKAKLKNAADIARELINRKSSKELVNADGSHPCKLHYFIGGCDWYISELDEDGVGFGYSILNDDLLFSEWGSVNVCGESTYEQPLTKMSISVPVKINGREFRNNLTPQLDLYLDEDTTIERELFKRDNEFFNEYEKYAKIEKNNEKELAKSSEVSINIIEETNQNLEAQYGSEIDNGLERRAGTSSGSNTYKEVEERGNTRNWGGDSREGQHILSGEREGNSELGHTERIPGIEQKRSESRFDILHSQDRLSGSDEALHSESSIGAGNSDLQSTGLEAGQMAYSGSLEQSEYGAGVNQNESVSDDPLQGTADTEISENRIELTSAQWKALTSLALNSNASWWIENPKNIGKDRYSVPKKDIEDLCAVKLQDFVTPNDLNIINELLEQNNIHYQALTIHVNQNQNIEQNPEQNIEKEADKYFDEITNRYSNQYAEFFKNYHDVKEAHLENETRYIGDARIRTLFENTHRELVNLQFEELTDIIKNARNLEIAKKAATRYFNFAGQDEFNYLHDNLFLRCHLGDYVRNELGSNSFVGPKPEELQNFITETYNSLHGIVAEKETPVYTINGTQYTQETIETLITEDIQNVLNTLSHVPVIEGVRLYQNPEQTGAINILLQYSTKTNDVKWSEDSLFNVLAQEEFTFNGMPVDVNPITPEKSGTIEHYLERLERLGITTEKKAYNFFVKDTAEFEQFEDFEPITNLTADEAINEYIKKYNEGLFAGIGINMPGDFVFDDPNGEGGYILLRKENVDTFKIMGDTFITELKEANERSEKYIKAYEELYDAALAHGLNVERPDFLFKKTYELYHKPSLEFDFDVDDLFENTPVDDKEYAENLADWIIQHGMNESTEMENYSVSFEDILENTNTTEEWLNAHIDLVNDALAAHNDNELLEYNPDENEGKEFNLYFCSNSDEMGENTLFKQNKEGRWIRKSEEELQQEKLEANKTSDIPTKENVQKKMFILDKLHAAGIEVVTDKEEFQWMKDQIYEINITLEMLEEKPFAIQRNEKKETGNLSTSNNDTLTRSQSLRKKIILDSSNSQDFIENLISLKNIENKLEGKVFLAELKKAFQLDENKVSNYVHNKDKNIELRLANHCANANDAKRYNKSTSIVIKLIRGKNAPKFRKSPDAEVIEFAYYPENLTLESEKAIVNGLIDWIKTGEYTNIQADEVHQCTRKEFISKYKHNQKMTTSEYQNKEVDAFVTDKSGFVDPEKIAAIDLYGFEKAKEMWKNGEPDWNTRMMLQDKSISDYLNWNRPNIYNFQKNNIVYGFAYEGKIYLNPEIWNSEVAVHEYTHLWDNYIQRTNPELWEKGKQIFRNTRFWNEVKNDPNYADIADNNDLILSEVHARICGEMADKILNKILEQEGKITADKVINWENEVDDYIYETFESERTLSDGRTIKSKGYGAFGTVVDINTIRAWFAQPMKDLMNGLRITIDNSPNKADFENSFVGPVEEKSERFDNKLTEEQNNEKIKNTISKLETIIKETYLTIPEGEESLTHDELQRRYDQWTRPMAREILEELKNGNQNIFQLINNFDLNKENHLKEGTYGTAEQRFKHDVHYELMPALYSEAQNKIIEKYDENKTPYVILHWSESSVFPIENKVYTLKEFNELLTQADKEFHNRKEYAENKYGSADNYWRLEDAGKLPEEDKGISFGYDKTEFKLYNIPNLENPEDTYSYEASRYDIGDGDGSVFDFIRTTCSHDVLIESCNKLEREMYYPDILEEQQLFVENAAKEEAALLKQNLLEKMEALDKAQFEYNELHKKWLIESSEAERVDEQIDKALADIKATYDNSISNLYTKVLNEYPFAARENISDSQFMLYTANEAKKMVLSELYLPSLESAKDYSKYNANDWDKFRKIFKQFPAKVNMTEYVENLLQEKCYERGISVSENIAQEERPVEQLTSKKDIKAIREQCREILQKSDSEITEADKVILAQYEGAGGIKEDNRTAAGVLNEFYTPNNLVEKVWQIVDAYAPEAKTVLEPSAGVGKFANNRPNNVLTMYELDETSARINKILHPEANIIQGAYQKQFFDAGGRIHMPGQKEHYDVVIGNPPYGLYNDKYKGLGEGKEFDRYEEYFISKGLDALKDENSIMAFVVPSGFLNTTIDKQKEIIAAKGRLIDAYRLPVGTFPTTEVGTDIIIMRTWEKDRKIIMENGKGNAAYKQASLDEAIELISDNISNGEWFKQHPEKILGEVKQKTNRFGKLEDVVVVHEGLTVQDELNKIDNFVEGINNSRKLRTYSVLNKDKINELTEVTQEEFNSIIDALYNQPSPDYKSIPSMIKLPQINQTLAQKLGVENANFFMRSEIAHVRPQRKGNYDQALRIDEMKGMLDFIKSCQTAYIDTDEKHQNFILAGFDSQDDNKSNKIVFNKDENGNYIVTIGKVQSSELGKKQYSKVTVGVEPTIWQEYTPAPATMLRPSITSLDSTIPQQTEKSSQVIEPAPIQLEQTQSVSDQSETVAEEIDDPSKRLYEDPYGVFKTNHKLTRQEFAHFYTGANFTSEDYNIWGATDWKGIVDLSKLTAVEQNFLKTSENYVEISDGVYTNAMLYATGNIYEKLDSLEKEKESLSEASYNRAKQILENAIPKIVPIEQIKMDALSPLAEEFKVSREVTSSYRHFGSLQLNTSVQSINLREDFINWATNCSALDNFDEKNQPVNTRRAIYNYSTSKIAREDIPEDISWIDIVNYIDKIPVPTHINEKEDTKEVKNKKNLIAGNIKDARKNTCYTLFNRYLQEGLPQEDKERLQTTWNKIYNATVHADYKKLPLFIDGMNTFKGDQPFMLYKQQVEGVSRLLSKGNGLLAYEVGVGKTAAGIVTTMGQLQTGRCKKPLIIVPNQVYTKWCNDFRQLFPDVKINELYNLSEKYISHCYDEKTHSLVIKPNTVTIITDSALQKITFSDKACQTELAEDFGYLLGLSEAINSGDDKIRAEAYQKIMKEVGQASRIQVKKLPEGREQEIQQSYIFFDECGFDNVVIDEAHRYKNLFTVPRPKRGEKTSNEFQGLGSGKPSIRAEKVFGITTLIQRHNEDRNVFLLTATPFTNNPLEVYSMLSYMGRKELINRHIYDVRDFCTEFAQTKFEYAVKPSGDIEPKQVMKNFRGQKKLKNLVFEYIDPVSAKEAGIARPEGERRPIYLELSPLQNRIIKLQQETIAETDNPYVMLKAMTAMRTCTLSPALLDPDDYAGIEDIQIPPKNKIVESSPKLSWVCNTCADLYKQKPECGQFIYMPQGKDYFDEVKNYLIRQGIPEEAIDYIHSTHNGSAEDKDKISARFNDKDDKLKILIGTATVSEGIDLNGNSIVEYNTMLGWNPTESIQVEGRIWRQGNLQGKVHIMYPLMENSIDALIYQKHDEKLHRINSVLSKNDDGNDIIETDEINPEAIKFELITDPKKKVKLVINEKTAEKRKEMKVIDNRIETLQELEKDRQNSKEIYDLNFAEKEKYKVLLKSSREELKNDPENWRKQAAVEMNERNVELCNKEIFKAKNHLNTISYNFNKFDIHDPEREVPIKLQELETKKAELAADVRDIIDSEARLIAEEQKKLLEKKMLSKPVEQLRKEWVEHVIKNTWYKKDTDKTKDSKRTIQKPIEAVKDFKVPDVMLKNLDKAITEKDFKVLEKYLCWGDRNIVSDCNENDKAIEIMRKRYEKSTGIQLPQDIHNTIDYLVENCDEKTLPKECNFKSIEEAIAYACSNWEGEAYQREGYVEYVTLDNFKNNRNVAELAKALQQHEGESYLGQGSAEFGYMCQPKGVKVEAFINKKREEFFVSWHDVAKIKAKQWNKEYPIESSIKIDEPKIEKFNSASYVQLDLFGEDELKQQVRTLDIRNKNLQNPELLKPERFSHYKGLPPFIKKSENEWVIRCKGNDFASNNFYKDDIVDVSLSKIQLQSMVNYYLNKENTVIQEMRREKPDFKGKLKLPKPEVGETQKALLMENGIPECQVKIETKKMFEELLCDGDNPILKKKEKSASQQMQSPIQDKNKLLHGNQAQLAPVQVEIIETDFDYEY